MLKEAASAPFEISLRAWIYISELNGPASSNGTEPGLLPN